jgi:outer membrane lipoprotein-sorting protein
MMVRGGVTAALALCLLMAPAQAQKAAPAPDKASPATPANAVDGWAGEVAASPQSGLTLDERQTAAVQTVSDYFGNLKTLKGNFVQIGADKKRMRGTFYVKRPGRFRFEYNRPSRQLIVSDGSYLAIQDLDLNNEDRVALDQTPFRLLLRSNVDLLRDARIFEVQKSEDLIVVGLQDKSPDTPGRIRIFLATSPELALKEWVTTDAQGLETRMEVSNLDLAAAVDDKLFKIQMLGAHRMTP